MITHFHILVGGFTQRYSMPDNGLSGIEYDILQRHGHKHGTLCDVQYLPWHVPAQDFARRCHRFGEFCREVPARIQIAGYSYGGQTAVDICWAFQSLGITVEYLTLIDPIRRRSTHPWGWLATVNPWCTIRLPGNVANVHWFYQRQSWPQSHRVQANKTAVVASTELRVRHQSADNHQLVRATILEQAAAIHNNFVAETIR